MKQRCRRCYGRKTIRIPFRDGSLRNAVCPVCHGSGVEWRKVYPPAPSRHFASDTKQIDKETAAMLKEQEDDEWIRTIGTNFREGDLRKILEGVDVNPDGPSPVP